MVWASRCGPGRRVTGLQRLSPLVVDKIGSEHEVIRARPNWLNGDAIDVHSSRGMLSRERRSGLPPHYAHLRSDRAAAQRQAMAR